MNVSAWSIKNPLPACMLFVLLTLMGLYSFHAMRIQNFPDIDLPTVVVTTVLEGATPSQLENDVARKIEDNLATVQGIDHVFSTLQDGVATTTAQFELEKPIQEAVDDVRSSVASVRNELPANTQEPIVTKLDLAQQPILAFTVSSTRRDETDLSWLVDNTIARKLLTVSGVGKVSRVGGRDRQVRVDMDPVLLQGLGATVADVSRQLKAVQQEQSGGKAELGLQKQPIRTLGAVKSADELRDLRIPLNNGKVITLSEVATVRDSFADPVNAAFLDGKPVVAFEVARSRGAGEVDVGRGVSDALAQIKAAYPDLTFKTAFDMVEPVQSEYDGAMHMLYEGALLAVLAVWLFLRDVRATLVSAVALPMSIIPAFVGMYFFGFTINGVTLLALSLVVGILVDDAIVEVENIVRHLQSGKSPYRAAMEAADEIGLAVVATTFTLIAVFLPTAFMSGIAGKFFKQFGWTAAMAVFASLVVARMLTPMMCAYLLKPKKETPKDPGWLKFYMTWVERSLRHRWVTVVLAGLFFIGSIVAIPLLPTGFMPADDMSQTQVYVELQPGTPLTETIRTAERVRQLVMQNDAVNSVYTSIGGGAAGGDPFAGGLTQEERKATLTVLLKPRGERLVKQKIEADIRRRLADVPGVRFKVGLGGSGEKYILVLSSEQPDALMQSALQVGRQLRTIPGLGNISSSASLVRPEVEVHPRFDDAAQLGVTSAAMADTLRVATAGDFEVQLSKLNLDQRQIPIVVALKKWAIGDLDFIENLHVPGARGPVPLSSVADVRLGGGPAVINRYDRARNITFEIELSGVALGDAVKQVNQLPAMKNLPASVSVIDIGDAEVMEELFQSFGLAIVIGIICIYIVLVLLFKQFLQPLTILAALPLSLGGAFVGLLLADKSFSMPSLIGLIMLMGIATKNSILLVEYAILAIKEKGMSRLDALRDACHKRARPILMTTLAMGAGMIPLAVGWGSADPAFRSPMAIAVLGGLITSTFLSLLVIPAVFLIVDDVSAFLRRHTGKLFNDPE
ncbi:ACR/RND family transmembrane transporter [Advenella kashmirensis W13003]|uniref:ACR/RND family transmembrane transporter n=1 Tax=Advenella kashmirensis W13003 TaxID=1424334 RepID=V8QQZ5_9BURK|nr:efflux RND transporter permease subunit [Advenella kashmirensis]ETF01768.1 ACR/RND family transmembrane transporter [Advenella kashmirensis W13003]